MNNCSKCRRPIAKFKGVTANKLWKFWSKFKEEIRKVARLNSQEEKMVAIQKIESSLVKEYCKEGGYLLQRQKELIDVNLDKVPEVTMDWIKEAMTVYMIGRFKSSIIIAGAGAEHLLDDMIKHSTFSSNQRKKLLAENHAARLSVSKYSGLINESEYSDFESIRQIRNELVHPERAKNPLAYSDSGEEIKKKAKDVLRKLIKLSNKIYKVGRKQ